LPLKRNVTNQSIAWFWDIKKRGLLDMNPPYQRRSVWNQEYKDYFIDTILNGYPCPPIFLHQEISRDGTQKFSVVDGKQRLSTVFEFIENQFPISQKATKASLRGLYFKDIDEPANREFWAYIFVVEYLPSSDEDLINNIFDRINRNVSKLSPQRAPTRPLRR